MPESRSPWGPPPTSPPRVQDALPTAIDQPPSPVRSWLFGVVVAGVAVALLAGAVIVAGQLWSAGREKAAAERSEERREAENRPELRDVPTISVFGPTWEPGADTYTMAFPDWPFAFRTPRPWHCFKGSFDQVPEAQVWGCSENMDYSTAPRVGLLLWECPTTCTEDEQQEMMEVWLDEPDDAVHLDDAPIAYVETEENELGQYELDLSRFAGDPDDPGGPLRWHVGVYLEATDDTLDDVLKILNDIVSQTA